MQQFQCFLIFNKGLMSIPCHIYRAKGCIYLGLLYDLSSYLSLSTCVAFTNSCSSTQPKLLILGPICLCVCVCIYILSVHMLLLQILILQPNPNCYFWAPFVSVCRCMYCFYKLLCFDPIQIITSRPHLAGGLEA